MCLQVGNLQYNIEVTKLRTITIYTLHPETMLSIKECLLLADLFCEYNFCKDDIRYCTHIRN